MAPAHGGSGEWQVAMRQWWRHVSDELKGPRPMSHGIESRSISRHHGDMASSVVLPLKVEAVYNEPATATQLALFPDPACSASNSSPTSTIDMRRR
jgi:hypothetical protein